MPDAHWRAHPAKVRYLDYSHLYCIEYFQKMQGGNNIISVAAGIVDGVTLKEKTWYKCVGGEFVEV